MRKMPLLCGIILGGLLAVLPVSDVKAAEQDFSVTVQTDVQLTLDKSDPAGPVFSGTGDIYLTTEDAASHKFVAVTLPEEFEIETPAGTKAAPPGTRVTYEGSMNARNGFENYQAINRLNGKTESDMYVGKIHVRVPFTTEFLNYGAGSYSLSIPVTLQSGTAYGSYSSYETGLYFTPWDELVADGGVTLSGTKLYRVNKKDMILDIDPSVTGISASFTDSTYKEVDIPSSVTAGYHAFQNSGVKRSYSGKDLQQFPAGSVTTRQH